LARVVNPNFSNWMWHASLRRAPTASCGSTGHLYTLFAARTTICIVERATQAASSVRNAGWLREAFDFASQQKCCTAQKLVLYAALSSINGAKDAVKAKDGQMSKTPKTAEIIENVEFPSFDASKAADQVRAFAEKGIEQSKETYARLKTGAEEAQKTLESTFETVRSIGNDLSLKTISALRANSEASFAHFEALVGAKSLSEVVELQTAFLRKGVEMAVEQVKELQSVTTKAAEDVSKPMKDAFEKAIKELKVA